MIGLVPCNLRVFETRLRGVFVSVWHSISVALTDSLRHSQCIQGPVQAQGHAPEVVFPRPRCPHRLRPCCKGHEPLRWFWTECRPVGRLRELRGGWSASHDGAFGLVVVIPSGLEPETVCLEGRCSIQLSYGTQCERFHSAKVAREFEPTKCPLFPDGQKLFDNRDRC